MGTQRSSEGPKSGVSLVPSWVLPVEVAPEVPPQGVPPEEVKPEKPPSMKGVISQPKRFNGTRRNLGSFAQNGSTDSLARGLGHYVRSGLGGAAAGGQRMAGTARTAGRLYGGLEGYRTGETQPEELGLDKDSLSGIPAREAGEKIIDALCPVDGTQDTEARRDSLSRSISELAEEFPNIDLTTLTPEQIDRLMELFLSHDMAHRVELDVGKHVFEKAASAAMAEKRIDEIRRYIHEKVSAVFRERKQKGERLTRKTTASIMARVIQNTLAVFEDYIK
jgi:hypothetical protein